MNKLFIALFTLTVFAEAHAHVQPKNEVTVISVGSTIKVNSDLNVKPNHWGTLIGTGEDWKCTLEVRPLANYDRTIPAGSTYKIKSIYAMEGFKGNKQIIIVLNSNTVKWIDCYSDYIQGMTVGQFKKIISKNTTLNLASPVVIND